MAWEDATDRPASGGARRRGSVAKHTKIRDLAHLLAAHRGWWCVHTVFTVQYQRAPAQGPKRLVSRFRKSQASSSPQPSSRPQGACGDARGWLQLAFSADQGDGQSCAGCCVSTAAAAGAVRQLTGEELVALGEIRARSPAWQISVLAQCHVPTVSLDLPAGGALLASGAALHRPAKTWLRSPSQPRVPPVAQADTAALHKERRCHGHWIDRRRTWVAASLIGSA